ncbi:hypothetical protein [Natrinema longum]|uniref:hypothetical protein n=1 Tax=Natrinema longum TaxID=370324 RepID=UPI001CCB76EF|nr:hypothetical protein [Natrinema longum]MBZ6497018.1 hypothetical protein [Natrinema longum]
MFAFYLESPVGRRVVEPVLAVLALLLADGVVNDSAILFETVPGPLWVPVIILVPGLLALSVLAGVLAHGIRLGSAVLGAGDRLQPSDTSVTRILASLVLGPLAVFTLWWALATLIVHYPAETGGVSPSIWALLFGGVLGALVLLRAVFFQLFPAGPLSRLRDRSVE